MIRLALALSCLVTGYGMTGTERTTLPTPPAPVAPSPAFDPVAFTQDCTTIADDYRTLQQIQEQLNREGAP